MSNSKTMAMQLAVQAGTPNDQLVERAREIHRFLTDEDPLKLDVPSPKRPDYDEWILRVHNEIEEKFFRRPEPNAKEVEVPIDWDRPQLVVDKNDPTLVVKVMGPGNAKSYPSFSGEIVSGAWLGEVVGWNSKTWACSAFAYYGEIPQEQKGEIDWSTPMVVVSKNDGLTIRTDGFHKGGSFSGTVIGGNPNRAYNNDGHYSQAWNKEYFEPKTTGLDFLQAIKAAKRGKNIRRARNWSNGYFWYHSNDTMYDSDGDRIDSMNPSNILATDWEIVQ